MNGIIGIDKPKGFTSFDVIAKLRGILGMKKIGHGGTLDPMATGVLPIFIGKATKAIDLVNIHRKSYIAEFKLGITTDTQDITGEILTNSPSNVSSDQIKDCLHKFLGNIKQVPPMYSAVKIGGRRLYELARKGKVVERPSRDIFIYDINLTSFDHINQTGELEIICSKGTYVRTLIHDLGSSRGCGATLTSLRRTSSMGIRIEDCLTIEELIAHKENNTLEKLILDVDDIFLSYPQTVLSDYCSKQFLNGVKQTIDNLPSSDLYRIYNTSGTFLGLGYRDTITNQLRVKKVFLD